MKIKEQFELLKYKHADTIRVTLKSSMKILFRILILGSIGYGIFTLQRKFPITDFKNVLSILVTAIGISVAIIISFLFSKIFSEKTDRIHRKREIDKISTKVSALRKISHFLLIANKYWYKFGNIKELDKTGLTLYDYKKLPYDEREKLENHFKCDSIVINAYLNLKIIEGNNQIDFHDKLFKHNYSLQELEKIQNACQHIWYFYDFHRDNLLELKDESILYSGPIKENLIEIYPHLKSESIENSTIRQVFSEFNESIIRQIYYLTKRNSLRFEKNIVVLLVDLLLFSSLSIASLLILSIAYSDYCKLFHTNIIVAGFVVTMIDLVYNIFKSINSELKINDFYEP
jgi:hypothetical protein